MESASEAQEAEDETVLSFVTAVWREEMSEEAKVAAEERREVRDCAKEAEKEAKEATELARLRSALQVRLQFYETYGALMDIDLEHDKVCGLVTRVTESGFSVDIQGEGQVFLPVLFEEVKVIELHEEDEEEESQQPPQPNP
jgi:predicted HAD superfamily Cof-like phosphohydrolase